MIKISRGEEIAVIGDGNGRHLAPRRFVHQLLDVASAVEKTVIRMKMQMNKSRAADDNCHVAGNSNPARSEFASRRRIGIYFGAPLGARVNAAVQSWSKFSASFSSHGLPCFAAGLLFLRARFMCREPVLLPQRACDSAQARAALWPIGRMLSGSVLP